MAIGPSNGKATSKLELASLLSNQDKSLVSQDGIETKIALMEARLRSLKDLLPVPAAQFSQCKPSVERLLPLLGQSVIDICYSMLRRLTTHNPKSIYDIISSCEKFAILPINLVEPIARQLLLIESDYNNLSDAGMSRLHREMPRMYQVFRNFILEARAALQPPADESAEMSQS